MWYMFLMMPAIAQAVIYGPHTDGCLPSGVLIAFLLIPLYVPFTLHFCNAPLLSSARITGFGLPA